jgi:hypothetical protein
MLHRLRKAFCIEICRVLSQMHPAMKVSLSALSVMCDLTSYLLHTILHHLTFVSAVDAAEQYVREEVRVSDTMNRAGRFEAVFAAKLASSEGGTIGVTA